MVILYTSSSQVLF